MSRKHMNYCFNTVHQEPLEDVTRSAIESEGSFLELNPLLQNMNKYVSVIYICLISQATNLKLNSSA